MNVRKKLESNELPDEMKRDSYYVFLSLTIFPSARMIAKLKWVSTRKFVQI